MAFYRQTEIVLREKHFTGVRVYYNVLTKEITCNGVKIFDVRNEPIALSMVAATKVKLEEQAFVRFSHPKYKVILTDMINS